tara:strand:+ start:154 stop:393 length:240 start_codon:yes stop_codon:yes gene_type:complete
MFNVYFKGEVITLSVLVVDNMTKTGYRRLYSTSRKALNSVGFTGKRAKKYNSVNMVLIKGKKYPVINHPHFNSSVVVDL